MDTCLVFIRLTIIIKGQNILELTLYGHMLLWKSEKGVPLGHSISQQQETKVRSEHLHCAGSTFAFGARKLSFLFNFCSFPYPTVTDMTISPSLCYLILQVLHFGQGGESQYMYF